jgi:hypothetical protein
MQHHGKCEEGMRTEKHSNEGQGRMEGRMNGNIIKKKEDRQRAINNNNELRRIG